MTFTITKPDQSRDSILHHSHQNRKKVFRTTGFTALIQFQRCVDSMPRHTLNVLVAQHLSTTLYFGYSFCLYFTKCKPRHTNAGEPERLQCSETSNYME